MRVARRVALVLAVLVPALAGTAGPVAAGGLGGVPAGRAPNTAPATSSLAGEASAGRAVGWSMGGGVLDGRRGGSSSLAGEALRWAGGGVVDGWRGGSGGPLVGDFDGDHRADVFWYGPGDNPDHHWFGRSDREFGGVAATVAGTYQPFTGDFDGDGRTDIFWYGPGDTGDALWYGRGGHAFTGKAATVDGARQALTGDFDGDHRTDILWYGRGDTGDALWYGRSDRRFSSMPATVDADSLEVAQHSIEVAQLGTTDADAIDNQPFTGDFDGDGRTDIFWYGPGDAGDALWYGRGDGGFSSTAVTVGLAYQPLVHDFDGDGRTDIFWYGPGDAGDALWYGRGGRGFSIEAVAVGGTYRAFVGDFDGDRKGDVFWYGPGDTGDALWYGRGDRGFSVVGRTATAAYEPMVADFDGDGRGDVFWYAAGADDDKIWFGTPGRGFRSRPTTIDLAYNRAVPLRQHSTVDSYTPFGFIAHANGEYQGHLYTNSLDAFEHNYARGFRVFEIDFVRLADGTVFAAHDGLEASYGLGKPFQDATWSDLAGRKFQGKYTAMRSRDVVELLRTRPDVYVILDTKFEHFEIFKTFLRQTGGEHWLMDRIIPHIQGQADLDRYRTVWPLRNYMVALYRTQYAGKFDDPEVVTFVKNNRVPAVMMWWKDRDRSLRLAQNSSQQRRFTPAFARSLQAAGAVAEVHSVRDPAAVPGFQSLHVGIYSDGPFGTAGWDALRRPSTASVTPSFPRGVIPA